LVRANFQSLRFFDAWYFQILPNFYVGAGIRYARQWNIKPGDDFTAAWSESPFVIYSNEHGLDLEDQTSAGPSLDLIYDNRDNQNDPSHGVFTSASFRTYFKGFLGGISQWQEFYGDFRTYRPLTRDARHRLALRTYSDLVTGGTAPYFSLPATGGVAQARPGRGYPEYRFRGEQLLYFEAEYRATLTRNGLFGMVFFANGTTVSSSLSGERLFDSVAAGGGFGFRFRLQKRSKTNFCVDFGFGRDGSRGVYVGIGEAF
jgi:outer membrane protein assembly factor BamA